MALLERERDLEALDRYLHEAAAGKGRMVLVGGEAGVGKTALVAQFCEAVAARGRGRVLRGACDALSTPRPLGPLQDIAQQTGGALDRLLLADAPRDRLFRALLDELSGGLTPTVAVVEDIHWADEATLDLLRYLARRLDAVRALVIATYRDDEVGATHPVRLVLGDLATTPAMRRIFLALLSGAGISALAAGSGFDAEALHRLTCGNPFFATEVLASGMTAPGELPVTVRDAVLVRAARLSPAARVVLDSAAAIGSPIECELLVAVAGASAEAIDACVEGGMLVATPPGGFAFRHELARLAILGAISPVRLQALHRGILAALQTAPAVSDLARLAHHAEGAGDTAAVLCFAPAAAQRAAALRAHREAAAQYARALRHAQTLPPVQRAELIEAYAYECYLTDRLDDAIVLRREAVAIWRAEGDRLREGDTLRWLSRLAWFVGNGEEAVAAAEAALAVLEPLPPGRELAMALSNRSQLHMLATEIDAAIVWGERAIALAQTLDDTEVLVHALNNVGSARFKTGNEQGRVELERSLALARAAGLEEHVARALTNLSWNALRARDLAHAETYFADGIAYVTEHDLDSWLLYMLGWRSFLRLLQGDWPAAMTDADTVLDVPHASAVSRTAALVTRGLVRARRGEPDAAAPLDEALALAEATGEVQRLQPVRIARAETAWLEGDSARASAELVAVAPLILERGLLWDRVELFLWARRVGAASRIGVPADAADLPTPCRLALAGDWAGAAAAWDALGCPYEAGLALLDGDELAIRDALARFERLGARQTAARAARLLREHGVRAVPRGPRPSTRRNPAQLTARELELLPLLAAGHRNAEIANRLFLSPKTVEHHVGHILAKLGVQSRADVAAAAARLGAPIGGGQNQDREPGSPT
jgi:ATP/maltotriose-dependent transcriptional regulator MalT